MTVVKAFYAVSFGDNISLNSCTPDLTFVPVKFVSNC